MAETSARLFGCSAIPIVRLSHTCSMRIFRAHRANTKSVTQLGPGVLPTFGSRHVLHGEHERLSERLLRTRRGAAGAAKARAYVTGATCNSECPPLWFELPPLL